MSPRQARVDDRRPWHEPAPADVEHARTRAWEAGRAAWPLVVLAEDVFVAHVRARNVAVADLRDHAADLYLAAACAGGDARAITCFERQFLAAVDRHLGRMKLTAHQVDDLRQDLRIKLLAGNNPRIASYAGRAPLDAWVRVAAIRLALDRIPAAHGEAEIIGEEAIGVLIPGLALAPDDAAVQPKVRAAFQSALERSLVTLSARDKALLRMYFVDALSIDAIGAVFRVHRATVARWLVAMRRQILGHLRAEVGLQLRPTSSEFHSLVRLVEPALQLSLDRLLAHASPR